MTYQKKITVKTRGRSTADITEPVQGAVGQSGIDIGLCHVFIHHTSASLMLCENADPVVRSDLERFMSQLAPDGDPMFEHTDEGPDDMPAHVRSILTSSHLSIPVNNGRCSLGTWQGIYLLEHRHHPHSRQITITIQG